MQETFSHPSYCLVAFSRRNGSPKLFGSSLTDHYSYVTLQVKKAELIREDNGDRYNSSMSGDIIEVDLSAAQFAELLTTMNVGLGVPGTLRRLNNQRVPEPPDLPNESEAIQESFGEDLKEFSKKVSEDSLPRARAILGKKYLSQGDKDELLKILQGVSDRLRSHVPFILQLFGESVTKRVSAAKTEVDSLFTTLLQRVGMRALQESPTNSLLPTLGDPDK